MVRPQDLFNIHFYEKSPFHGSLRGMHYRIEKITDGEEKKLKATVWPGPYNFETTDDALKTDALFPFSNEGLAQVCRYLNEVHDEVCAKKPETDRFSAQ